MPYKCYIQEKRSVDCVKFSASVGRIAYSKRFEMTGVTVIPLLLFMFIGFFPFCNTGVTMPVLKISGICLSFKMVLKQIVRNVISILCMYYRKWRTPL
jgi:hypothetical protein